jgi:hypothetical protein
MTGRLGGSMTPMEPATVTRPRECCFGYLAWVSMGSSKPPMARMVMPEAPVSGVKKASKSVTTTASPPGSQPAMAVKKESRRWLAPPAARIYPASVNSGIAGSMGEVAIR